MFDKLIIFDTETTGTDPKVNGMAQLTAQVIINGIEKDLYNEFFKPLPGQMVEPKALEVNGLTMDQLRGFQEPRIAFDKFMNIIELWVDPFDKKDKFTLVGYNSRFDDDFMRQWFRNVDDSVWYGSFFRWPAIDVANLAAVYIGDGWKEMENFKLATVAKHLGLEVDESRLHDSEYDVDVTAILVRKGGTVMTKIELEKLTDKEIDELYRKVWAEIQRRAKENVKGYFGDE